MAQSSVLVLLVLALGVDLAWTYTGHYENEFDKELNFQCPEGQLLSYLYSIHGNYHEDRRWRFGCRSANYGTVSSSCQWTPDYVNNYDGAVNYLCPANMALAGVHSVHSNYYDDRRMKFKCCGHSGFKADSCEMTPSLNKFDRELKYNVPSGRVIAGWVSVHFKKFEDRRHFMIVCSYST
ncbi:hypothetical protein RRG08_064600 [Elysia crispata]|uniref:Dermatopontin n=1 Tax=Elysia crispata TaxID=231223 RepID=A0AAE1EC23_9GAST|nr:hypothetical protein RRG08_064600 [Elysia crispata]